MQNWTDIVHFRPEEFACPCCGAMHTRLEHAALLDRARALGGAPMRLTSGFRCERHNREVGGSPESSHLSGWASDIVCSGSAERLRLVSALLGAGFTRIGVANGFVHADNDPAKDSGVLWLY